MSGSQADPAKTSTQGITSTQAGDNKVFKASDVTYAEEELPDTMIQAIRIIERLLTQLKFHEQQVLYKAYPSADIARGQTDEEEEAEKNNKNNMLMFGGGKEKKKEEERKMRRMFKKRIPMRGLSPTFSNSNATTPMAGRSVAWTSTLSMMT